MTRSFFPAAILAAIALRVHAQGFDYVSATGGDATNTVGNYRVHLFTNSAAPMAFEVAAGGTVELLVVAGGGGGGFNVGGGGGGGGLIHSNAFAVTPGSYPVIVGAGGLGSSNGISVQNGSNSVFGPLTAIGGGGGGDANGRNGGSGGGGYGHLTPGNPGTGQAGQGNDGGPKGTASTALTGSGGGGAGGPGAAGISNVTGFAEGGAGLAYSITGVETVYAAGGRGGGNNWAGMTVSPARSGRGGDGAGTPNYGKDGGSGIVVVRYLLPVTVESRPATAIGLTNATLNGVVISTADAGNPRVYVCWGPADGGTNSLGDWPHTEDLGQAWGAGQAFGATPHGLLSGSGYVYRCFVSNSAGTAWSASQAFTAGVACYVAPTNNGTADGLSWPTARTNLQAALDQAGIGDTVYIRGGSYSITSQLILTHSGVTILGGYEGTNAAGPGEWDPARWPTLLARPAGTAFTNRILLVSGVDGGTLGRLVLTNGYLDNRSATRTPTNAVGGCLCILGSTNFTLSSLTLSGGSIRSEQPRSAGAGLFVSDSANLILSDCLIQDNVGNCINIDSLRGGGVYATNTSLIITNSVIRRNSGGYYVATGADHGAFGAGLHLSDCQATVVDTVIAGNSGGGHSTAVSLGAGAFVDGGSAVFRNCLIAGNDNRINSNDSSFNGDGVYVKSGAARFANCTLVRNNGEGIYRAGGAVTVSNCIVWDNLDDLVNFPADGGGALAGVGSSCIEDGDNDGVYGCFAADPLFERGLYLAAGSPCADAGGETAAAAGLAGRTTRADGTPDTGLADLGFHFAGGVEASPAGDLYVDPAGSDTNSGAAPASAFRSVTRALSAATHGSRLHIAPGVYTNRSEGFPLTLHGLFGVELRGTDAATTVIKATGAGQPVLVVRGAGYAHVEGLTLTGGTPPTYAQGGGLSIRASRLTVGACVISNNVPASTSLGAGLWARDSFLRMTNCLVTRNTMGVPGGSVPWAYGGGLFVQGGELVLLDSRIVSNTAPSRGASRGGGLSLGGNYGGGRHLVSNCVFLGNTASSLGGSAQGGGLFIMATAAVSRCVIAANAAVTNGVNAGGGVFLQSGVAGLRLEALSGAGDLALENVTLAGNSPDGVWQNTTNGPLSIRSSILWDNGDDLVSSNMAATLAGLWYSDIEDGDNAGLNGCFSADPRFAEPGRDWHLQSHGGRWTPGGVWVKDPVTSPGIDAGDPAADYSLEPEPNGRRVNLGAYGNTAQASKRSIPAGSVLMIR